MRKDIRVMLKLCKNWNKIAFLTRIMLKNGNNEYFCLQK